MGYFSDRLKQQFPTKESLSPEEYKQAQDLILKNGLAVQGMVTFTTGIFLVDFSLLLGASNTFIGLLSAVRLFSQVLQVPSVYLVEKIRVRRAISVYAGVISRATLIIMAVIPFFFSLKTGLIVLLFALTVKAVFAAIVGCSWNSWMRDLVPIKELGAFFGRRLFMTTLFGMILGLLSGLYIDWWKGAYPGRELQGYSLLFLIGFACGMWGIFHMAKTPEPTMHEPESHTPILELLKRPFREENFRYLLIFSLVWNFAINLTAPFFTVYLIKQLNYDLFTVVGLGVLSQIVNLLFFRIWGRFADQFSNKAVLAISGSLYNLTILAWVFTTLPEKHPFTFPLVIIIHTLLGVSLAGVTLASGNISLKLSPKGESTSYLAAVQFINSIAAGTAPLLGGWLADRFDTHMINLSVSLESATQDSEFIFMSLTQLDFLFLFSFLFGLYALRRLALVRDQGRVQDPIDLKDLISEAMVEFKGMSTLGGLRHMVHFPISLLFSVFKIKLPKNNSNKNKETNGNDPPPE